MQLGTWNNLGPVPPKLHRTLCVKPCPLQQTVCKSSSRSAVDMQQTRYMTAVLSGNTKGDKAVNVEHGRLQVIKKMKS